MKKLKFSTDEQEWLTEILLYRINQIETQAILSTKFYESAKSALAKVTSSKENFYRSWEVTAIVSCINEHLPDYFKTVDLSDALSYLTISQSMRKVCNIIDLGKDILQKCRVNKEGLFLSYNFKVRYRDRLEAIEQLKQCDVICLARSAEKHFYKIALVNNEGHIAVFKFDKEIDADSVSFSPSKASHNYQNQYDMILNKSEALGFLNQHSFSERSIRQINFLKGVLN